MRSAQRGSPWYRILPVQVFWIPRSKLDRNVEELELDLQWTRATADASLLSATMSEIGEKGAATASRGSPQLVAIGP